MSVSGAAAVLVFCNSTDYCYLFSPILGSHESVSTIVDGLLLLPFLSVSASCGLKFCYWVLNF